MKIYVASSWRNAHQPAVVAALRDEGHHEVYDFRHPPGSTGFTWTEIDKAWQGGLTRSADELRGLLEHSRARAGYEADMAALSSADACVLVGPCGRSAHLELGWAAAAGKRTLALLGQQEPELMYRMVDHICVSVDEVLAELDRQPPSGAIAKARHPGPSALGAALALLDSTGADTLTISAHYEAGVAHSALVAARGDDAPRLLAAAAKLHEESRPWAHPPAPPSTPGAGRVVALVPPLVCRGGLLDQVHGVHAELARAREELAVQRARASSSDPVEAFVARLPLGWELRAGRHERIHADNVSSPSGEAMVWILLDEQGCLVGYSVAGAEEALERLGGIPALSRAQVPGGR